MRHINSLRTPIGEVGAQRGGSPDPFSPPLDASATGIDPIQYEPGSFSVSTQLMQDAVQAEGVSVGAGRNQEAVFSNPFKDGREEALIIDAKKQLTYLERTDSSDTGWVQTPLTMRSGQPNAFIEVVVAVHPNGSVWAFCVPYQRDGMKIAPELFILARTGAKPDGTAQCAWTPAPAKSLFGTLDALWSLSVSYTPNAGPTIMGQLLLDSGITCVAVSALANDGIGMQDVHWMVKTGPTIRGNGRIVGGGYLPDPRQPAGVYVYYTLDKTTLTRFSFSSDYKPGDNYGYSQISTTVQAFCGTWNVPGIPHAGNQVDLGYIHLEANGDLVTGYYPPAQPGVKTEQRTKGLDFIVTKDGQGNPTSQPISWQDIRGMLHIYGITGTQSIQAAGTLSVLHQTGWVSGTPTLFDPVFPAWTSAKVAGAPAGIGGFDLMNAADRLVAFDFTGSGKSSHLLASGPGATPNSAPSVSVLEKEIDGSFKTAFALPATEVWPGTPVPLHYEFTATDHAGGDNCVLVTRLAGDGANSYALYKGMQQTDGSYELRCQVFGLYLVPQPVPFKQTDQMVAFDYSGTGKNDHLLIYRPGSGLAWVLRKAASGSYPFEIVASFTNGVGGFPLTDPRDRITGFDYDSTGSSRYLLAYRPGGQMAYIVTADGKGGFAAVVSNNTGGIGGWDLKSSNDRLVPFDYSGLGFNDHILAYRPGPYPSAGDQQVWVLERVANTNTYSQRFYSTTGAGGYDFAVTTDLVTGLDWTGSGGLSYVVAYRPGTGKVTVMGQRGTNNIAPVYQSPPADTSTLVTIGVHANITGFMLDPQPDFWPSELIKMSGVSAAEAYCLCTQDITTSEWQIDKVRLPDPEPGSADPFIVSHYVATATLKAKDGSPIPGYNVTVSADSLVEIQVGAISYQVGPGRAITVTTDSFGKLALSVAARGLNPPTIHLNADGLASGTAINLASQVNDFLAGKGSLPSQTGLLTADVLENAKAPVNPAGGAPVLGDPPDLVPNWGELKDRGLTPQIVVDHFRNMYAQAASGPSPALQVHLGDAEQPQAVHSYVIQLWDPDRPAFLAFANQAELDAYKAYRAGHPAFGGWWEDAVSWASDTWEGIKTGASRVAEVIVSEVIEIAVWIGDAVVSLGEIVIAAVEQAVQAVEAVFQMIADAVTRAIDWLKSLFAFSDIWKTKIAIDNLFQQSADIIPSTITYLGSVTDGWFQEKRLLVHNYFEDLKATYRHSYGGDLINQAPPITGSSGETIDQKEPCPPQGNWMLNQINVHEARNPGMLGASMKATLGADGDDALKLLTDLWTDVTNCGMLDALGKLGSDLLGVIQSFMSNGNEKLPLIDLFSAVEQFIDAVLAAADDLVQAILKFASGAVSICVSKFNEALTGLPVLDRLYQWVQQQAGEKNPQPLTLSGLFTLAFAFVATFTYKLIAGVNNTPFPDTASIPVIPKPSWDPKSALCAAPSAGADPDPVRNAHILNVQVAFMTMATVAEPVLAVFTDLYFDGGEGQLILNVANQAAGALCLVYDCPPIIGVDWGPLKDDEGKEWGNGFTGMWACNWIGWVSDGISMIVGSLPPERRPKGAAAVPLKNAFGLWGGAIVVGALGLIKLCLAIEACAVAKQDWASWTSYVTGTVADFLQLARAAFYKAADEGYKPALTLFRLVAGLDGALVFLSNLIGLSVAGYELHWKPAVVPDQTLDPVKVGVRYDYKLTATFKNPSGDTSDAGLLQGDFQLWTASGLPAGLTMDKDRTGHISGYVTDTSQKSYTITTSVWDSYGPPQKSDDAALVLTVEDTPVKSLTIVPGYAPTAGVGTAFDPPQNVKVLDAAHKGVDKAVVVFTVSDTSKAAFDGASSATVFCEPDGSAQAPALNAGPETGSFTVTAAVPGVSGASAVFSLSSIPGPIFSLAVQSGAGQKVLVGYDFEPLVVKVADAVGNGVENVSVRFTAPPTTEPSGVFGDGQSTTTIVTNRDGLAKVAFTANGQGGDYKVHVAIVSLPKLMADIALTNLEPVIAAKTGDSQMTPAGKLFDQPLSLTVTDNHGAALEGVPVVFTIDSNQGVSASFPSGISFHSDTNSSGVVTTPPLTANSATGSYQVRAVLTEFNLSTTFALTNI